MRMVEKIFKNLKLFQGQIFEVNQKFDSLQYSFEIFWVKNSLFHYEDLNYKQNRP